MTRRHVARIVSFAAFAALFGAALVVPSTGAWPAGASPAGASLAGATAAAGGATGVRYLDPVFSSATVTNNLTYGSAVNDRNQVETLKLDLYRPAGDAVADRPAVVVVHGGGFVVGNKGHSAMWAEDLAKRGYVAVSIDYRLATVDIESDFGAYVAAMYDAKHDAQAAVRWLRKNAATYGIDPARIGMTGGSAGAATSLLVAFDPTDVGDSGNPGYASTVRAVVSNSGTMGTGLQSAGDAPALMLNGTADTTVKYANAKATCDKATAVHLWCTFVTFPGVGHTVGKYQPELLKSMTATYFYDHLATAAGTSASPFPDAIAFVQRQYRDLLLRDADPAGLDYWSRRVAHGTTTPAELVDEFAQSAEMARSVGTVTRSFLAYLGRVPDPSGLSYWVGKIRSGKSVAWVNASLAASSEFQRRQAGLTDPQFIDALYRDLLNRAPDAGGKAHWLAKLAAGTSRADVVGSFVAQPESIRATAPYVAVTIGTSGLLGRAPTKAEVDEWVPAMRSGAPATDWYESVLESAAYRTRITP